MIWYNDLALPPVIGATGMRGGFAGFGGFGFGFGGGGVPAVVPPPLAAVFDPGFGGGA